MQLLAAPLLLSLVLAATLPAQPASVPRFAPHEVSFTATGTYENPYVELMADAMLTEPDGRTTRTLPLFWDGGGTWKMRFAPDQEGVWTWTVRSADPGLDGRKGRFVCVASERRGSIQPMEGAPRHFQYQNGEPMWFLGDTAWAFVTDNHEEQHDRAAVERYVSIRAEEGFNVVHFMLLSELGWPNRGGVPWTDIENERINPAYFAEADHRIAFANSRGIVAGVVAAWGHKGRDESYSWGRLPGVEARKRFARYVAARFGAYDVYFLVSGEWQGEVRSRLAPAAEVRQESVEIGDALSSIPIPRVLSMRSRVRQEFVEIGDALRAADPHRRMTGIHPMWEYSTSEFNALASWMDFADYQQNYRELHERALAVRTIPKPVVNSEYGYFLRDMSGDGHVDKPNSYTVDDMRHATWDIVMGGAYVVTGFGSTYLGGARHPTPFLPDDPANRPLVEQIGHMRVFFGQLDYQELEPSDELLSSDTPRGKDRAERFQQGDRQSTRTQPPATTYWCLAEAGSTYVVYVRGMEAPVDLALPAGRGWEASRFDPRTGRSRPVEVPVSRGRASITPPDRQDWLFVLRRTAGAPANYQETQN